MKGHNFKKRNYIIYLVAISFSMAFISIFTYQLIKNNKTIDNDVILVDDNRGIKNTVSKDSDDCLVYTKYNNEVEVGYTSIEEALDVFNNKAGCTLTLNNDVTISSTLIFTKSGTLDLNGHILALQDADDIYGSVIRISSKATLNLVDSSPETTHYYIEEKTVKGTNEVDEKYRLFVVSNTKTDVDNEYYVSGEIKGGVITGGNAYSTSTSTYKTSQFNNSANVGGVYV
jgi:hypothetical protein